MLYASHRWQQTTTGAILRWNCGWAAAVTQEGERFKVEVPSRNKRGTANSLRQGMYYAERVILGRNAGPEHRASWVGKFRGEEPLFPDGDG